MILSGCSSSHQIVTKTEYVVVPEVLDSPCKAIHIAGNTYRDLAILAAEQKASIEECNVNYKLRQEWYNKVTNGNK